MAKVRICGRIGWRSGRFDESKEFGIMTNTAYPPDPKRPRIDSNLASTPKEPSTLMSAIGWGTVVAVFIVIFTPAARNFVAENTSWVLHVLGIR